MPDDNTEGRYKYVALAQSFQQKYGKPLVFWGNEYWEYIGTHYRPVGHDGYMRLLVDRWHQKVDGELSISNHTTSEIEGRLRSLSFIPERQAMPAKIGEEDKHRFTTTLRNGILDLEPCLKGGVPILRAHTQEWFSTACLPYEYEPEAKCPKWLAFLEECLEKDMQRINLLQEWFGYCCTYDTSYEKAMFLEGQGGNGKSQAIEVLIALVGKENTSAVPLDKLAKTFQIYPMLGKLVNTCGETDPRTHVPIATLRGLITGDLTSFERKGVDAFMARPTARFTISMNQRPQFADQTNALWRRIILMPWNYKVPEAKMIRDLGQKIAAEELPGIFNWAVEGLKRLWRNNGFTESSLVEDAVENMRAENDPIRVYLIERFIVADQEQFITKQDIWDGMQRDATRGELLLPAGYTPARMSADIVRVFPTVVEDRPRVEDKRPRAYRGITNVEQSP